MKRLVSTKLFCMLEKMDGMFNPAATELKPIYDDFAHSVIFICTAAQGDVSPYFTLHYTRLELEAFLSKLSTEGAEKKCENAILHCPLHCIY